MKFIVIFICTVLVTFWVCKTFFLVVHGDSMYPTFQDRDFVLIRPVFFWERLNIGSVYVFKKPISATDTKNRFLIKRLNMATTGYRDLYFLGDNPDASYDSRYFGLVPRKNIRKKVIKLLINLG